VGVINGVICVPGWWSGGDQRRGVVSVPGWEKVVISSLVCLPWWERVVSSSV
jgi:hypothetical protein